MSDPKHTAMAVAQTAMPEKVHPLVAQMMAASPDPATLRELLAIQREWEASESKRAFTTALVALKRDLPSVVGHDAKVDYTTSKGRTHYTHATLAHILTEIEGPMTAHGFTLTWQSSTPDKNTVQVTAQLTHADGHTETCTLSGPPDPSGNKNAIQAIASTETMLKRHTGCSLLGLATKDMQDASQQTNSPDAIDAARSMKAAKWLKDQGHSRAEAETYLGKSIDEWTLGDLDDLKTWVKSQRQPGEEG